MYWSLVASAPERPPLTLCVQGLVKVVLALVEPVLAQDQRARGQAEVVRALDLKGAGREGKQRSSANWT